MNELFAAMAARRTWMVWSAAGLLAVGSYALWNRPLVEQARKNEHGLTKDKIAEVLGSNAFFRFPAEMEIPAGILPGKVQAVLQYSFDQKLQQEMEKLFASYAPDYGAFVAIDATTGRVLSMVSYTKDGKNGAHDEENLALRATFPSASVFKVVTASAAIEAKRYTSQTVIPFNGGNHTLYKSNILKDKVTRWTRYITLKDAFARSVNTVFGKIGAFTVGPAQLRAYADRFGFNRKIASDIPMQEGRANIPDDSFGIAESASGYTRENTMSPLQGALIAAAIANDGVMMEPFVVDSIFTRDGSPLYKAEQRVAMQAVDSATASEVRKLMYETVARGTSRHAFRGFFKQEYAGLNVGGKTGSLTGLDPKGKYDWFVGFASSPAGRYPARKIAIAALTIHEKRWTVKSSYVARRAIESVFDDPDFKKKRSVHVVMAK